MAADFWRKVPYSIVGIAGVTNGGKTSLSIKLKQYLLNNGNILVHHFNMDDYFREIDDPAHARLEEFDNYPNYDSMESVDWERLYTDVHTWIADTNSTKTATRKHKLLLIEGIMVLNYKPLQDLYQKKFFLTLTKDLCWERRRVRVYDPPDPPGYFDAIAWPMHLDHMAALAESRDIVFLDGALDQDAIFRSVTNELRTLLPVGTENSA